MAVVDCPLDDFLFWQHGLERLDGHGHHVVLRRARRQVLQPEARLDGRLDDGILTAAREADDLIRDARDDRQQQDARGDALREARPAEEREDEDRDEHDDQQEVRAAARMEPRELLHVLDRQRQPRLIAVDRLVLRPVVLEDAADVLHARDAPDVAEEDCEAQEALHEIEEERVLRDDVEEARRARWDRNEEDAREHEREEDRARHLLVGELFILLAGHLGRIRERADADDERLNERDRAAQHRLLEDGIAVRDGVDVLRLDLDLPVRVAHRRRRELRPAHHDALDDRLAAYH